MPVLAIRLSGRVNAVSERHGVESRRMWSPLWPGLAAERVPIGHVTNGVHLATWISRHMWDLLDAHLGAGLGRPHGGGGILGCGAHLG